VSASTQDGEPTVDGPPAAVTDPSADTTTTESPSSPPLDVDPEATLAESGPPGVDARETLLDVPKEALGRVRSQVAVAVTVPAQSEAPTQRPPDGKRSLFAGLLAEAKEAQPPRDEARGEDEAAGGRPPSRDELEARYSRASRPPDERAAQHTLGIEGRGRPKSVAPPARSSIAPPPRSSAPPPRGSVPPPSASGRYLGPYKVLGELGSGGMAVVHKAVQPSLDRLVAIKELRPEMSSDKQILARFEREATSLATLQHGNIVHIYDFVRDFDSAYIVMEYVEGIDLFDVLAEVDRLPADVAAVIALQLAHALEYAHYRGIIHRDVKPSNVLVSKIGEVKIMDFGIARDPGRADITQVGMALGTPAYMAPEQIRGDRIDFRADLFSFGICLYEMLTGEKPWADDGGQTVARRILVEDPVPVRRYLPDVPVALETIIGRCLHKSPDRRYSSTFELRRALEQFVAREVALDARQRVVVFLRNRRLISDGEASGAVEAKVLDDPQLRRLDLNLPPVSPERMLRRVFVACVIALAGVCIAGLVGAIIPYGRRLAEGPQPLAPAVAPIAPAGSGPPAPATP
jgi:serine/threonine protein kinase